MYFFLCEKDETIPGYCSTRLLDTTYSWLNTNKNDSNRSIFFFFIQSIHLGNILEVKECYEKSKDLSTGCEFIKCFHERYQCNDESVTAWAYELCQQFPKEVIFQFTPEVKSLVKTIRIFFFDH